MVHTYKPTAAGKNRKTMRLNCIRRFFEPSQSEKKGAFSNVSGLQLLGYSPEDGGTLNQQNYSVKDHKQTNSCACSIACQLSNPFQLPS